MSCDDVRWESSVPSDPVHQKVGCSFATSFLTQGSRTLRVHVHNDFGGSATAERDVKVEPVQASEPPIVSILSPSGTMQSAAYYAPGTGAIKLEGAVQSPGGYPRCTAEITVDCLSLQWRTDDLALGASEAFMWDPTEKYSFVCGGYTVPIELCATDPNGQTCSTTYLHMGYDPC